MRSLFSLCAMLLMCAACAQQITASAREPEASPAPGVTSLPSPVPSTTPAPGTTPAVAAHISAFCPSGPFPAPLPQHPSVLTLNSQGPHFDHFDGPVWLPTLSLLYVSAWNNSPDAGFGPESAILSLTAEGSFATVSPAGHFGTNGLALDGNGCIVAAAHDRQEVARFCDGDPNTRASLASMYRGRPFNSPNDAAVRADGTIYFTDPDYQQDGRAGQSQTRVYRISPTGDVTVVDPNRDEPNGIALSLDENTLFIGGNDQWVMAYPVLADGSTNEGVNFINLGTNGDGMVVDCAGNLYVALYSENRVGVWDAQGQSLGSIPVADNVTNLAFGGTDRMTLYITAVSAVQSTRLLVPGLPH